MRLDAESRELLVAECQGVLSCQRPEHSDSVTREPEGLYNM